MTKKKDSSQMQASDKNVQLAPQKRSPEGQEQLISELTKEITRLQVLNAKQEVTNISSTAKTEARHTEELTNAKSENPSLRIFLSDGADINKKP